MAVAFVFAIIISAEASAASWAFVDPVDSGDEVQIITSVDKDSIKRGTSSRYFPKYNRKDGFSAIVKIAVKVPGAEDTELVNLVSFFGENGVRKYCLLDVYGKSGSSQNESDILTENVDSDGTTWPKVWKFVSSNLK